MAENQELNKTEPSQGARGRRKTRIGTVVSDKMDKTVVVRIERRYAHPLYGKQVTRSKKYHAHDEENQYHIGDVVRIMETRPLSKLKRWRVVEALERAR
jgi:small subunit ribosomal protein S17